MIWIYLSNHILEGFGVYAYLFLQYPHNRNPWIDRIIVTLLYSVLFAIYQAHNLNLNILSMLLLFIPVFYFLIGYSIRNAFNDSLICFALIDISELLVESATYLFRPNTDFQYNEASSLLYAALSIKIVFFILLFTFIYIQRKSKKYISSFHNSNHITISLFALVLSLIALQNLGFISSLGKNQIFWIYIVIMVLIAFSIIVIILTEHMQKEHAILQKTKEYLQQKEIDESYSHLIKQLDQEQKILIHDYKNHLIEIESLISKQSYAEAQIHIKELTESNALNGGEVLTDNHALSILLSRYKSICNEQGIRFSLDTKDSHLSYLSPADVTSLFCNLMDNAIDACSIVDSPDITLRIGTDTIRNMDIIIITNTCVSHPEFEPNGLLATIKEDKLRHGFGMQSIQRVVDKYKGTLDAQYSEEDSLFQITINLYPGEKNNGYINL